MMNRLLKKEGNNTDNNLSSEKDDNQAIFQERPRICLIDVDESVSEILKAGGFNCTIASFGSQIKMPSQEQRYRCLANHTIPSNLHEYEVVIIDLKDRVPIPYNSSEHQRSETKRSSELFFLYQYPQNIFDPRCRK